MGRKDEQVHRGKHLGNVLAEPGELNPVTDWRLPPALVDHFRLFFLPARWPADNEKRRLRHTFRHFFRRRDEFQMPLVRLQPPHRSDNKCLSRKPELAPNPVPSDLPPLEIGYVHAVVDDGHPVLTERMRCQQVLRNNLRNGDREVHTAVQVAVRRVPFRLLRANVLDEHQRHFPETAESRDNLPQVAGVVHVHHIRLQSPQQRPHSNRLRRSDVTPTPERYRVQSPFLATRFQRTARLRSNPHLVPSVHEQLAQQRHVHFHAAPGLGRADLENPPATSVHPRFFRPIWSSFSHISYTLPMTISAWRCSSSLFFAPGSTSGS